jgi:hypothetical protein
MPLNDNAKGVMLQGLSAAGQALFVGLHTLTDPGTATNANSGEVTGGSPAYARQGVVWATPSGGVMTNTGALTFDVPAGTYGFFTLWTASTGNTNNYRGHIPFGGSNALRGFFSVDTTLANDQFFSVSHGMSDGDRVLLYNVFSEALPVGSGLTEGALLYVVGSTANTFKVSTTLGGTAIDITGLGGGEGYWQRIIPETFGSQGQITVAVSALAIDATAF